MIPLSQPDLSTLEIENVTAALKAGWISGTGPQVAEFEGHMSRRIGRRHVIATANGTMALELALRALEIGPGDEVIVPALTFAAPALTVLAVGATPVLADIDLATWTMDVADAAAKKTRNTKAILTVDVLGHPCDYDALETLSLPIVEDAAEAHGAFYKGKPVGSFGIISTFSFHANKSISTGEGGCVATDSDELMKLMRLIVNHGMSSDRPYVHNVVGRNYRMTNLTAALGVAQIQRWDELVTARNRVSGLYTELLAETSCKHRPVADWADYSCWLHTICTVDQIGLVSHLRERFYDARAIWAPLSAQLLFNPTRTRCPVAESISAEAIWLPTYSALPDHVIRAMCRAISDFSLRNV